MNPWENGSLSFGTLLGGSKISTVPHSTVQWSKFMDEENQWRPLKPSSHQQGAVPSIFRLVTHGDSCPIILATKKRLEKTPEANFTTSWCNMAMKGVMRFKQASSWRRIHKNPIYSSAPSSKVSMKTRKSQFNTQAPYI